MTTVGDLLQTWLPQQRWYGAKGRPLRTVRVAEAAPPERVPQTEGTLRWFLATVGLDAGEEQTYQVPLVVHPEIGPELEHAVVGRVDGGVAVDAPADHAASELLLELVRTSSSLGGVRFTSAGAELPLGPGLPLGAEQSNTSLVYGDSAILKLFRRITPGVNPDLEITRALADAGSPHVAAPLGWIETALAGEPTTLGVVQTFLKEGSEGWRMACASVRDLLAEADLHADEVGGDFAGESERLGSATAEVHQLLAEVLGQERAGADAVRARVQLMQSKLAEAVAAVTELAPFADAVSAAFDEVLEAADAPVQRIHGDYHLGQVMRVSSRWVLLDFEGEPARPLAERRSTMSPLRDVAGMLRSFDYAARSQLIDRPGQPQLVYRATEWAERNRAAFCDGYAAASGADPRGQGALLRAFELDKAVYEVMYEARNRPGWLGIPLGSVARLVGQEV